jgi:hypothetical protein
MASLLGGICFEFMLWELIYLTRYCAVLHSRSKQLRWHCCKQIKRVSSLNLPKSSLKIILRTPCHLYVFGIKQRWKNSGSQVSRANEFWTVEPNICGSLRGTCFHVTSWRLEFWSCWKTFGKLVNPPSKSFFTRMNAKSRLKIVDEYFLKGRVKIFCNDGGESELLSRWN